MKILAIDTTAKTASVALLEAESAECVRLIGEYNLLTGTHSTTLLPMIESVLKNSGASVDVYAASVGPGSFTGIRIGVSAVKGLAFVKNTACVGVSSLDALAYGAIEQSGLIIPAIDARRETVYTSIYRSFGDGRIERITEEEQIPFCELLEKAKEISAQLGVEDVYMLGDAYGLHREKYLQALENVRPLTDRAGFGAALAASRAWFGTDDKSAFTDQNLNPAYLKKSQAERERDEMLNASKN